MTGISSGTAKRARLTKMPAGLWPAGNAWMRSRSDYPSELVGGIDVVRPATRIVVPVVISELLTLVDTAGRQRERGILVEQVEDAQRQVDVLAWPPLGLNVGSDVLLDLEADIFGARDIARGVEDVNRGQLVGVAGLEVQAERVGPVVGPERGRPATLPAEGHRPEFRVVPDRREVLPVSLQLLRLAHHVRRKNLRAD